MKRARISCEDQPFFLLFHLSSDVLIEMQSYLDAASYLSWKRTCRWTIAFAAKAENYAERTYIAHKEEQALARARKQLEHVGILNQCVDFVSHYNAIVADEFALMQLYTEEWKQYVIDFYLPQLSAEAEAGILEDIRQRFNSKSNTRYNDASAIIISVQCGYDEDDCRCISCCVYMRPQVYLYLRFHLTKCSNAISFVQEKGIFSFSKVYTDLSTVYRVNQFFQTACKVGYLDGDQHAANMYKFMMRYKENGFRLLTRVD